MSIVSSARSNIEHWRRTREQYQAEHPGAFLLEEFLDWAIEKKLVDLPKVNPKQILRRRAKDALRAKIRDPQDRIVREVLPAKIPLQVDANGQLLLFEIRYDHIHTMSEDHALLAFALCESNI